MTLRFFGFGSVSSGSSDVGTGYHFAASGVTCFFGSEGSEVREVTLCGTTTPKDDFLFLGVRLRRVGDSTNLERWNT